ncbi:MAG: hypothetical protein ACFB9M_09805 [Myxococcota bacterium]
MSRPTLVLVPLLLLASKVAFGQVELTPVDPPTKTQPQKEDSLSYQPEPALKLHWLLGWNMSLGTFDTFDFASDYSFRGASIEARYTVAPSYDLGISVAVHNLSEKETDQTITNDVATANGTIIRTINFVPILLKGIWSTEPPFLKGGLFWAGTGIGAVYIEQRRELGTLFRLDDDSWHFGISPELGFAIPLNDPVKLFTSTAWNFAIESGSIDTQSYLNFNIGLYL